jgi:AcrR family transcriptional regulator
MTVEEIAIRAGVSKVTIYKWWPEKLARAVEAFLSDITTTVQAPDTGSVAEDLRRHVRSAARFYTGPAGRVFGQLIAEGQGNSKVAQTFRERFLDARRKAIREILDHGVARGELRTEVDANIAIDLIMGAMTYRLLAGHEPLNDKFANLLVETVLRGCLIKRNYQRSNRKRRAND